MAIYLWSPGGKWRHSSATEYTHGIGADQFIPYIMPQRNRGVIFEQQALGLVVQNRAADCIPLPTRCFQQGIHLRVGLFRIINLTLAVDKNFQEVLRIGIVSAPSAKNDNAMQILDSLCEEIRIIDLNSTTTVSTTSNEPNSACAPSLIHPEPR